MNDSTEITVIDTTVTPIESGPALDLRSKLMTLPVESMNKVLADYDEKQAAFRKWIYSHLVRGIHYGFPPGTAPKYDAQGNVVVWNKRKNREEILPPDQWRPKESLYKAGADRLCELLTARDEYEADLNAWKQLGEPPGTFVFACRLYCRATGVLLGEGRGVRAVGDKGGDANNAIKMAKKAAKVDAALNTWGLSDLFTQDLEDMPQQPDHHANPAHDEKAPKATPRSDRVTLGDFKLLTERWERVQGVKWLSSERKDWDEFAMAAAGIEPKLSRTLSAWSNEDLQKAHTILDAE